MTSIPSRLSAHANERSGKRMVIARGKLHSVDKESESYMKALGIGQTLSLQNISNEMITHQCMKLKATRSIRQRVRLPL